MTFHDLMVTYVCLALVWCLVGTFGEWVVGIAAVCATISWITGSKGWEGAAEACFFILLLCSRLVRMMVLLGGLCFSFAPSYYTRDRD